MFRPSFLCASLFVIFGLPRQVELRQFDRPGLSNWTAACGRQSSVASPDHLHSAFIACSDGEEASRTLHFTVMDSAGKPISELSAQVKPSCTPGTLEWLDDHRAGVVCQTDPQVRNYVVFDIQAANAVEYPGYWFQWSPDRKTLADVKVDVKFGTPAGENSCLLLNLTAVYPAGCDHAKATYSHIHMFMLPVVWAADGGRVAFVEKIFDWEYWDPFLRYFDGETSNVHYYLVVVSAGHAGGYPVTLAAAQQIPVWQSDSRLQLGAMTYDLDSNPPLSIP